MPLIRVERASAVLGNRIGRQPGTAMPVDALDELGQLFRVGRVLVSHLASLG